MHPHRAQSSDLPAPGTAASVSAARTIDMSGSAKRVVSAADLQFTVPVDTSGSTRLALAMSVFATLCSLTAIVLIVMPGGFVSPVRSPSSLTCLTGTHTHTHTLDLTPIT